MNVLNITLSDIHLYDLGKGGFTNKSEEVGSSCIHTLGQL